ncbi:TMEM175 family protein [Metallibacterium scheffleri]|uniref:TMEM175 family protein n=1 Tax=Metallibacterium scheffleri TaxID=993689 RepID=UPI0023F24A54|nr:TMEM175 family protein [Metallibacterium scheffleri]
MRTNRLEAFSDGVMAIIITIMVLELKVPHGATLTALKPLLPVLSSYVLSFVYIGIYWNNHHHLFHAATRVSGGMLWANLHLLFWLSLFPFVTGWMGENHYDTLPTALYGTVLLMAAIAYWILEWLIVHCEGAQSLLARAVGGDFKGKLSIALYAIAIALAFVQAWLAQMLYLAVALLWLVPDRRIERLLRETN